MSETYETGHSKVYETPPGAHVPPSRGYEGSDLRLRPIIMLGIALAIAAVVGHLALAGMFAVINGQLARRDAPLPPVARPDQPPPQPQLQVAPRQDWDTMLATHSQRLHSYGWVDQNAGTVHIPIERAMDLVLQRGLPTRSNAQPFEQSPDFQQADDLDSEGGQPPGSAGRP